MNKALLVEHLRDYSPTNQKKNVKRYLSAKPVSSSKKNSHNTPSPLMRRDRSQDSKSRRQSRSGSRAVPNGGVNINSRRNVQSCRHRKNKSTIQQVHDELVNLKEEYKTLMMSYDKLLKDKMDLKEEEQNKEECLRRVYSENDKLKKTIQKYKSQLISNEKELQRIKKECFKLLEIESFKNKKLQQTLQQKQLMIHYLRNQIGKQNMEHNSTNSISKNIFLQSTTPIFRTHQSQESCCHNKPDNGSFSSIYDQKSKFILSSISHENNDKLRWVTQVSDDSLSFSKDKSRSITHNPDSFIVSPTKRYGDLKDKRSRTFTEQDNIECHTFELKESNEQIIKIQHKKPFKKKLELSIPEQKASQSNTHCYDQSSSVQTKKRGQLKSNRKDQKEISNRSIERKMKKIQIVLPKNKNSVR